MRGGTLFDRMYPAITWWISQHGWIELGYDEYNRSFVRALDLGGMPWEGGYRYASVGKALAALETALAAYIRDELGVDLRERKGDDQGSRG